MQVTISPSQVTKLLAPFVGWRPRVDAVSFDTSIYCRAESNKLRITTSAGICPVAKPKSARWLAEPLFKIAQQVETAICVDGDHVRCDNAEFELERCLDAPVRPAQAEAWMAIEGHPLDCDLQEIRQALRTGQTTAIAVEGQAFLLSADDCRALEKVIRSGASVTFSDDSLSFATSQAVATLLLPCRVLQLARAKGSLHALAG